MNRRNLLLLLLATIVVLCIVSYFVYAGKCLTYPYPHTFVGSRFIPDSCRLDGRLECPSYAVAEDTLYLDIINFNDASVNLVEFRVKKSCSKEDWCTFDASYLPVILPQESLSVEEGISDYGCHLSNYLNKKIRMDLEVDYIDISSQSIETSVGRLETVVRPKQ